MIREGWLNVGDEVKIVERGLGEWRIRDTQEMLYGKTEIMENIERLKELVELESLGEECRGAFRNRLQSLLSKSEAGGEEKKEKEVWREYTVKEKTTETNDIINIFLQRTCENEGNCTATEKEEAEEEIDPGHFVRLKLPNNLIRSYSIVSGTPSLLRLSIHLSPTSLGGSSYIHHSLSASSPIQVGKITPSVPINSQASHHIFICGGIGITAFLSHLQVYDSINYDFIMHYAVKSREKMGFKKELEAYGGERVKIYGKEEGERMDVRSVIEGRGWNSMVYVCGPDKMVQEAQRVAKGLGLGRDDIHFEAFQADTSGDPFEVQVRTKDEQAKMEGAGEGKKGKVIKVGGEETLLQVLRKEGYEVESSCEVGNCGSCKVRVCEGNVLHRGSGLLDEEKENEGLMLSCVSRALGRIVIDF